MIKRMNYLLKSGGVQKAYKKAQELKNPNIYSEIKTSLSTKLGGGTFHYFGSRMMGIATEDSDLDIFISFGNSYYEGMQPTSIRHYMKKLKNGLYADPNWEIKQVVPPGKWHASFIRAYYRPDDIMVDISFDNGLAVENTRLLAHFFNIQPGAAKFCLFMKQWLKDHKVEMKNYGLVLLVIHFLQWNEYLPTMYTVQDDLPVKKIAGYEVQFDPQRTRELYDIEYLDYQDTGNYIVFFQYYKFFGYADSIVSTKDGEVKLLWDYRDWKKGYINVAGPIMEDINVMASYNWLKVVRFQNLMEVSYEELDEKPIEDLTGNFIGFCLAN